MKIVLVSCCSKKQPLKNGEKVKACELYISPYFKACWEYAKSLGADKIYILSAKHGLLNPTKKIEVYNETLNNKRESERKNWASKVLSQMRKAGLSLQKNQFIFLSGKNYYKHLIDNGFNNGIKNYERPFEKFSGIGYILQFLKRENSKTCPK